MIASDSDSKGLSVDVVIPTFRRPEKEMPGRNQCQTIAPRSIIVIDDSEKDLGPAISRNLGWKKEVQTSLPLPMTIVFQQRIGLRT